MIVRRLQRILVLHTVPLTALSQYFAAHHDGFFPGSHDRVNASEIAQGVQPQTTIKFVFPGCFRQDCLQSRFGFIHPPLANTQSGQQALGFQPDVSLSSFCQLLHQSTRLCIVLFGFLISTERFVGFTQDT